MAHGSRRRDESLRPSLSFECLPLRFRLWGYRHRLPQRGCKRPCLHSFPQAAAPVAQHKDACRHGSSGLGLPADGSSFWCGVCLFSGHSLVGKPPAGPSGGPSRGLQCFPVPPCPRRGICSVRSASPWFHHLPERLRLPSEGLPCAYSLRLGFASGRLCAHALRASGRCSLALRQPDHSGRGGSGHGNAGDGCRLPVSLPCATSVLRETASSRGLTARARSRHAA